MSSNSTIIVCSASYISSRARGSIASDRSEWMLSCLLVNLERLCFEEKGLFSISHLNWNTKGYAYQQRITLSKCWHCFTVFFKGSEHLLETGLARWMATDKGVDKPSFYLENVKKQQQNNKQSKQNKTKIHKTKTPNKSKTNDTFFMLPISTLNFIPFLVYNICFTYVIYWFYSCTLRVIMKKIMRARIPALMPEKQKVCIWTYL